jgi:hypothetical protein
VSNELLNMADNLQISNDLIRGLSTGIIGSVITAIGMLVLERIRHSRLKRDNKKLTQEVEEIKSSYTREIEELKHHHNLDITKRKYRYEKKSEEYMNFFAKLDELNSNLNVNSFDKLKSALDEYNRNAVQASSTNAQNKALIVFQKKVQAIIMDSNKDFVKLRHETNNIKFVASENVRTKLQILDDGFKSLFDDSGKLLSMMPALVLSGNEETINSAKEIVIQKGLQVEEMKDILREAMREELNEI